MKQKRNLFFASVTLFALLVCFLSNGLFAMNVKAEGSTYYVRYNGTEWRYQKQALWANSDAGREVYYMMLDFVDGDNVIIDANSSGADLTLDFKSVNPGTITVANGSVNLTFPTCNEMYLQSSTVSVINGNVVNAHIYSNAIANFNKNVSSIEVASVSDPLITYTGSLNVVGTADKIYWTTKGTPTKALFTFPAGTLSIDEGTLVTNASKYSTTDPGTAPTVTAPAPTTSESTSTATTTNTDEYDDVPKTGDSYLIPTLLLLSSVCAFSAVMVSLKKKATLSK